MGKFNKLKAEIAKKKEEEEEVVEPTPDSNDDSDTDSETEGMIQRQDGNDFFQTVADVVEEKKRAVKWTNRERVLLLCSRGADVRTRHLMSDLKVMMPHAKGDSKLDQQKSLTVINEIAEMKNCTKIIYFESRKRKDTYMWLANVEGGPSIKFLLHNVHTMMELKLSGNCLKASRPILSFDSVFDEKPQYTLIKHAFMQTFSTANYHPRSQPFFDHVFSFSITPDGKIWFRNFQIVDDTLQLQEIGPRFVLEVIRVFAGSFEGEVLYDNPDYVSPNAVRRQHKLSGKAKYLEKQIGHKMSEAKEQEVTRVLAEKTVDPAGEIFDTDMPLPDSAQLLADVIDKKKRKNKLKALEGAPQKKTKTAVVQEN